MNVEPGAIPGPEPELAFWFDFASTYSYIAAMRIGAICEREHVILRWVPFLLGPIFQLQGWNDSPFNINTRRGDYMWIDVARLAAKYDLPWVRPTTFPRASTLASRVACSISNESWCGDFVRSIFIANFGANRDIGDPTVIASVISQLGRSAADVLERACDDDHRGLLRANTDRALKIGIFGAPNCVVNDELFWGEETLEDAIAWLKSDAARS
jgi:2-hydroxychromene-2-carboxylate isomerase